MKYYSGDHVNVGDRVRLWPSVCGVVVCSIDDGVYSQEFPETSWAYKGKGIIIKADNGQIFYYDEADEDFELLERHDFTLSRILVCLDAA
jgi:hypothetical protein